MKLGQGRLDSAPAWRPRYLRKLRTRGFTCQLPKEQSSAGCASRSAPAGRLPADGRDSKVEPNVSNPPAGGHFFFISNTRYGDCTPSRKRRARPQAWPRCIPGAANEPCPHAGPGARVSRFVRDPDFGPPPARTSWATWQGLAADDPPAGRARLHFRFGRSGQTHCPPANLARACAPQPWPAPSWPRSWAPPEALACCRLSARTASSFRGRRAINLTLRDSAMRRNPGSRFESGADAVLKPGRAVWAPGSAPGAVGPVAPAKSALARNSRRAQCHARPSFGPRRVRLRRDRLACRELSIIDCARAFGAKAHMLVALPNGKPRLSGTRRAELSRRSP